MIARAPRVGAARLAVLLLAVAGCASRGGPAAAPSLAEAEPIHDTIGEFRRSERIACAEGTDLVYVVSRDGSLHSFDPGELRFRRIGKLECPGATRSLPQSMAVDRSGQAWVGYDNGVLALASITNGDCVASRVNVRTARIGTRFGMGFAPTAEGGIGGETLFLTTEPAFGRLPDGRVTRGSSLLVRIDDGSQIRLAGPFPAELRGLTGELSSRSDGKLFAFFTGEPFSLAEVDPATAAVRSRRSLEGMRFSQGGGSWAFAAVGPEFYFFWADQGGPSTVTRLREDGTLEHVIRDAGMEIVGAGASTCATAHPSKSAAAVAPPPPPPPPTPIEEPRPEPPPPVTTTVPFSKLPRLPPPTRRR